MTTARSHKSRSGKAPLPDLISTDELADLLQIPISTIYYWRQLKKGPRAMKVGRHLRFDVVDVTSWIEGRRASA